MQSNTWLLSGVIQNVAPASWSGSAAPVLDTNPKKNQRKQHSGAECVTLPVGILDMATGGSQRSCGVRAQIQTTNEYSGSGSRKDYNCPAGNQESGAVAQGERLSTRHDIEIMFGVMISWKSIP
jgi:hypothetical protein